MLSTTILNYVNNKKLNMKNIFLIRQSITILFYFCIVLLSQSCKKEKQVPIIKDTTESSKFYFKETFENRDSVYKTWILFRGYIYNKNNDYRGLNSNVLDISLGGWNDSGYAKRNFTNFEGTKIMKLSSPSFAISATGVTLTQYRDGKLLKTANYIESQIYDSVRNISIRDTFSFVKTDTLQIKFLHHYIYYGGSGPNDYYYDNIELREQ